MKLYLLNSLTNALKTSDQHSSLRYHFKVVLVSWLKRNV